MIALVAFAVASAFDAVTTMKVLKAGGTELNPLYGSRPSATRVWGTKVVGVALAYWFLDFFADAELAIWIGTVLTALIGLNNLRQEK